MKEFVFKFGIASVLIVGGFLAVCVVAFPRFFASSEAAINNRQNALVSPTQNTRLRSVDNATDVPEAEYQSRRARIRQLFDESNFEGIVKEGDEIQAVWATTGGERYAKLILEVIYTFGYSRIADGHPEVRSLSEKYATVALERADTYSLESERYLVMSLGYYANLPSFNEAEALKLRNSSKLWLRLLARLERERDTSADPYLALQKQLSAPENPYWNDEGSNPVAKSKYEAEMTEYNAKRKWLSDQYRLRNVAEVAEPWGTKFLANVYSRPPFSRDELSGLLSEYQIAESLRRSILKARNDLVPNSRR